MYSEVWMLCFSRVVPLHFLKSIFKYWELAKADVKFGQVMACNLKVIKQVSTEATHLSKEEDNSRCKQVLPFNVRSEDLDAQVMGAKPLGAQMRCKGKFWTVSSPGLLALDMVAESWLEAQESF